MASRTTRRAALAAALLLGVLPLPMPATAVPDLPAGCGIGIATAEDMLMVGTTASALPGVRAVAGRFGGEVSGGVPRLGAVELRFPSATAARAAAATLRVTPGVAWAEPERTYRALKTTNDPMRRYQWGIGAVNLYKAWDRETGAKRPVTVAVLDTGIDYGHPDLAGRTVDGPSAIATAGTSRDDQGHGTLVGGVIGAIPNNKVGVAGAVWNVKLLSVKVLNDEGTGTDCSVINGYLDAVEAGAQVVNMSLGAAGECPTLYSLAMRYGEDEGVVNVAASGNDGAKGNPVETPASCNNVIAVGAVDSRLKVAPFSGHHDYVALSAPGVSVMSTYFDPETGRHAYGAASGTSLAAPYVAGVAALVLARYPTWTPAQVRDRLTSSARDLGPRGRDPRYGYGIVDAARAIA